MGRAAAVVLGRVRPALRLERGDVVVGWLVRLVAGVAVAGLVLFDAISVGVAAMSVTDQASTAARAASDSWLTRHDQQQAFDAAWQSAVDANAGNTVDTHSFRVQRNGTVELSVHRTAPTLVLRLLGPLSHWAVVTGDAVARSSS
jgi:hypothetical protein